MVKCWVINIMFLGVISRVDNYWGLLLAIVCLNSLLVCNNFNFIWEGLM